MIKRFNTLFLFVLIATLGISACQGNGRPTEAPRGLQLPQSPLLTLLERKSGLISYMGDDGNIYVVNQSGEKPVQITSDARLRQNDLRRYFFPTWSPDAKSLAFFSIYVKNQTDISSSIYSVGVDGKNLVQAYTSKDRIPVYLSWSPDAKSLSFITGTDGSNALTLSTVSPSGGTPQTLDVGSPYYWDWTPDSKGVLIHTGGATAQNSAARLSFLTLTDGVVEDRLSLNPSFFQTPDFSPDGKQILLATESGGKKSIVLTDRTGRVQQTVDTVPGTTAFSWSPDGKKVAYIVDPQSTAPVRGKLNFYDVGKSSKVTADQDKISAFFWSPDSKKVAYFVINEEQIPTPTPKPGATPEPVDPSVKPATVLLVKMYSTDVSNGKSTYLGRFPPTDDFLQMLQYFDQYSRAGTIWSPDGEKLVVAASQSEGQGIFLISASGNTEPRFLQAGTMAFWSWK